jgi:hypothetical protein
MPGDRHVFLVRIVLLTWLPRRGLARTAIWWKLAA